MPKTEFSEMLFILIMFVVIIIISTVSIYLFVRQFKREKASKEANDAAANKTDKE